MGRGAGPPRSRGAGERAGAAGELVGSRGSRGEGRCRRSRPGRGPVPPERGPEQAGERAGERAGAKKNLTCDLIACISAGVARGSALLATNFDN